MVIHTKILPDSYTHNIQCEFLVSAVSRLPDKRENKGIKPAKAKERPGNFPARLENEPSKRARLHDKGP
jgi:hypothetical protein